MSAVQSANPNVVRRWTLDVIRIPSLFDLSFALPDPARLPNSSTLTRARRKPPLAGHRYDFGPVARAARQQNSHQADSRRDRGCGAPPGAVRGAGGARPD